MAENRKTARGFFYAALSAATFGLIPLFTIPMLHAGISTETVIVYRFGVAVVAMLPIAYLSGHSLLVSAADLPRLAIVSGFYVLAGLLFFHSLAHLPSSIGSTLYYLYPVMVMFIMIIFFGEKFSRLNLLAIVLAIAGVAFLSQGPVQDIEPGAPAPQGNPVLGICLALGAALANAFYMIALKVSRVSHINTMTLTFYILAFGFLYSVVNAIFCGTLQWISGLPEIGLALLLGLVTVVLANIALIWSIQLVGPTMSSILGAAEPLTAVVCGVAFLGDPFGWKPATGVGIILLAVFLVIYRPAK